MATNYIIPKAGEHWAGLVYRQILTTGSSPTACDKHTWFITALSIATGEAVTVTGTVQRIDNVYQLIVTSPERWAGLVVSTHKQSEVRQCAIATFHKIGRIYTRGN